MIIRKALIKDLKALHILNMKLVTTGYRFSKLKNPKTVKQIYYNHYKKVLNDKNSVFFVAEEKGKIIGFVLGEIEKSRKVYKYEKRGYVSDIFVFKSQRMRGIGKKLIKELFSWFKSKGIKWVRLHVDANSINAINFWKEIGFKDYKIEMDMLLK